MTPKIMQRITAAAMLLGAAIPAGAASAVVPPEKVAPNSTYCNPLNLDYCFRPDRGTGREAADPVIVPFKGNYYLFPSKSAGYWWSPDLINWNLVPSNDNYGYIGDGEHAPNGFPEKDLPVWGYNPAAAVVDGALVYSQQCDAFYRFIDPKQGTFERFGDRVPVANDEWLFTDDDGKVYVYAVGFKPERGIYVTEINPKDHLKVVRGPEPCMPVGDAQPDDKGFFRIGPAEAGPPKPIANKTGEGTLMTKRNGIYHLQISVRCELPYYCDVAYTSKSPWGPFKYSPANPVAYRPVGFGGGAGNSGTFTDSKGNDWRVVTAETNVFHCFERRVALYPAGSDKDMLYTDTYLGDLPQRGVGGRKAGPGGNLVGWMLLSHKKPATASSTLEKHPLEHAFDGSIRTWWSAKTGDKGEWLAVDLGKPCRINAVQVNFAEQDVTAQAKRRPEDELYHQYVMEASDDGKTWKLLVDKSANRRDVPHDYVQLETPVTARHLKLTNIHMAGRGKFALRDLRVFGSGLGKPPAGALAPVVKRGKDLEAVQAEIEWPAADGATGYVVRWGQTKDQLYHSQDVRDGTKTVVAGLTGGLDYFFVIDSFNDSGVTFGKSAAGTR